MTDALKMTEMQRTNIEFERQRHLANWLIKSSAHMAKPSTQQQQSQQKSPQKINKNGTVSQNPLFFVGKVPHTSGNNLSLSKQPVFTSQTNLPLQIVTTQDGQKPKLRRFNSHDTSANMFSAVDFENARLARRNEVEKQRYKMNSLSSGTGDCSTGDSKGSKFSNESNPEPLPANIFLDKYSLPRVVRIPPPLSAVTNLTSNTMQSSSSNESSSSSLEKKHDSQSGELFLLFRHIKNRKNYHGFNPKHAGSRKKGVKIPMEYTGFFSLTNDRGAPTATMYTTIIQLVRERVYKFLTVENMTAYTESQSSDTFPPKTHYVKGTARAGTIFRLLAVFQDGGQETNVTASQKDLSLNVGREKEKGRYAQLLGENRQIVYVSLTAKGKFYEIEQSVPQIIQKTNSLIKTPKVLNPECVHQISNLITIETELPVTLKYISGPRATGNIIPEQLTIVKVSTESIIVACPIEETENRVPLHLRKLFITNDMKLMKCFLGFENEQRMFLNQNVQNLMKFCQLNCDNFLKLIETEQIVIGHKTDTIVGSKNKIDGLKILRPLNFARLLHREKSMFAHEKEDSIIFLSKNDLENMEIRQDDSENNEKSNSDKMKVFQNNSNTSSSNVSVQKKKWYRNFKNGGNKNNSFTSLDVDIQNKKMSLDRYQDMSKLLQERFGGDVEIDGNLLETNRPSSDIGVTAGSRNEGMKKCISLQDFDTKMREASPLSHIPPTPPRNKEEKPDLVKVEPKKYDEIEIHNENNDSELESMTSFNNQQSFITKKLYSEFHVKTKHHSKSSSSLHQLLHFAVPQKMNISETKKKPQLQPHKQQFISLPIESTMATEIIDDDLPYSNVRDSLLIQEPERNRRDSENIYSEICSENINFSNSTPSSSSVHQQSQGSIRISISSNNQFIGVDDNIYNTIK